MFDVASNQLPRALNLKSGDEDENVKVKMREWIIISKNHIPLNIKINYLFLLLSFMVQCHGF